MREELARVEALGGEGLMLREPRSEYVAGRSSTLLKVKTFHDDEAEVIGHQAGLGKHKGRLGALLVKLKNGIEFAVGTGFKDAERSDPPKIGATITFRYQEYTDAGVPRFPSYVRLREDGPIVAVPAEPNTPPEPVISAEPVTLESEDGTMSKRYFEFVDDKSSKFWEVWQSGCDLNTRWGKIGSDGRVTVKSFPTEEKATSETEKITAKKIEEGYVEKK